MPWVKLSDDWYDDTDLIEAGPMAMLIWPLLVTWSARNLTDGKIPEGQIRRLVDWHTLGIEPEQAIAPLIEKGRLQSVAGAVQIANYLRYQPSREQVLAERDAARGRAAKSRERAAHVQGSSDPPVPVPVPDPSSSSSSSSSDAVPAEVWSEVATKKLARAKDVGNAAAWKRKVIANERDEHGTDAAWIWDTYEITVSQLADVIVSGNRGLLNSLPKRQAESA